MVSNFVGQQKDEEIICIFRQHWIVILPLFVGFLLFTALSVIAIIYAISKQITLIDYSPISIIFSLLIYGFLHYYLHRFFLKIINYYFHTVIVTTFRLIEFEKTVILTDSKDAIDLIKVQDIIKKQDGLIKNIFNYGDIIITISAVNTTKTLNFAPDPDLYFRTLNRAKREHIAHRQRKSHQNNQQNHSTQTFAAPHPNH